MRLTLLLVVSTAIHFFTMMPVSASECAQNRPVSRPDSLSTPCRAMYQKSEAARLEIQRQYDLKKSTVDAIALIVIGAGSNFTDASLIVAIDGQAKVARTLVSENRTLREIVARLEDSTIRDPALASLTAAEEAINEGRFIDAEREFDAVRKIRWSETAESLTAWKTAVSAQANAAILTGDYDRAENIRLSAASDMKARVAEANQIEFEQVVAAAGMRYEQGLAFGRVDALARAAELYREMALPLAPRSSATWAATQNDLGLAYKVHGNFIGGSEGLALLDLAIAAFEAAANGFPDDDTSLAWATAETNLAMTLVRKGELRGGSAGMDHMLDALNRYQALLRVYSEISTPMEWALVQTNLGAALGSISDRFGVPNGPVKLKLLEEASFARKSALRIYTETKTPIQWAQVQSDHGAGLAIQSQSHTGPKKQQLLAEAVAAYRAALNIRTETESPIDWAATQYNLGIALGMWAQSLDGSPEAQALLADAAAANKAALRVYSESDTPVDWAAAKANLGTSLSIRGRLLGGPKGKIMILEAIAEFEAALLVYDRIAATDTAEIIKQKIETARKALGQ